MRAAVYTTYGPPSVLHLKSVEKPVPADREVLIRVAAAAVSAADCAARKGSPFMARMAFGLRRPKMQILGTEFAGEIEAVGKDVTRFKVGDQVFAASGTSFGAHAEYICLPEDGALAPKPTNMTFDEAVATCEGTLTALPFLRDHGRIRSGYEVLINGASGSVGTAAVQLARYFGATVTGVCGTANQELVKSLGADRVIDYTKEDFLDGGQTYDIIFDAVGKSSFSRCKRSLTRNGVYLTTVPSLSIVLNMLWTSKIGTRRARIAFTGLRPPAEKSKDLLLIKELVEAGQIRAIIDRRYDLDQIAEAHAYVETGHKRGNVILNLKPSLNTRSANISQET